MVILGRLLTIAALSLAVSGCGFLSWTRVTINEPLSDTDAAFMVPGQTPVAEVVAHLGAPDEMVLSEDGAVVRSTTETSNISGPIMGGPCSSSRLLSL